MEESGGKSFGRQDEKGNNAEKPRYDQRAYLHDYHSPSIYMITIRKAEEAPFLSEVKESAGGTVYCDYHPLGYIVLNQIRIFNSLHPDAPITNHVIMPDHFHFMIHVKKRLTDNVGLGRLIACLKTGVRNEYMQKYPDSPLTLRLESPLVRGFNDMILLRDGQLDKMIKYIKDNPRRYLIKKRLPDLFKISRKLLIIAPTGDCSRKGEISRQICQSMNALAEELASNPTSYRLRLSEGC